MPPKIDHDAVLAQFREQLIQDNLLHEGDSIGTDDRTLTRFLYARHYNLKQAKVMWKACQHWRKTVEGVGIDELYRSIDPWDYPERDHVFNCWPLWFHKTDKKGRPLNIHFFGSINMPELYKHITPERHWQTVLVNCESLTREVLPAATQAAGRPVDGTFVIVDLKGFGLSQFWQMKNLARASFQISQDYFPETMSQLAIVNAPASFTTIWSFIKPWLAKETVAKVDILGTDYQDVLLKLIDKENLPACLGGACTCEGKGGCEQSNAGPWSVSRKERRERWLRGEGDLAVHVEPAALQGGVRGTLEGDKDERKSNHSGASSLSASSHPIDIRTERDSEDRERDSEASSQSTQASTPGPATPPLESELKDLSISTPSPPNSNTLDAMFDKRSVEQREDITPTKSSARDDSTIENRTVQTADLHTDGAVTVV